MKKLLAMMGSVALAFSPFASSAEGYQFVVGGDPAAAATANSVSAVSPGRALATDSLSAASVSRSLEARFRTWCVSLGRALRSDDWANGLILILR